MMTTTTTAARQPSPLLIPPPRPSRMSESRRPWAGQPREWHVEDRVLRPVLVVVVPPFGGIDGEALRFHGRAQELTPRPRVRGPARVVGIRALRHLVVRARHLDLAPAGPLVQGEVHRAAAVVARALARVGHELLLVFR